MDYSNIDPTSFTIPENEILIRPVKMKERKAETRFVSLQVKTLISSAYWIPEFKRSQPFSVIVWFRLCYG